MYTIDFENHFYDKSIIQALANRKQVPSYDSTENVIYWNENIQMPQGNLLETLLDISDKRIQVMDENGIDKIVLSTSSGIEQIHTEESIEWCKQTNNTIAALTKKYPGRFLGSMVLPEQYIDEALAEMQRCVNELGFVAWHTHSNYGDTYPDESKYRPLFKKAEELGIYVYLHPALPSSNRFNDYGFAFAGPALGFTVDAMTTLLRLLLSGLFDDCPNLKMVVGHFGEALPFLLERIENRLNFIPNTTIKMKKSISTYFKQNIWVTTSGNLSKSAYECTKEVLGVDKILFASDYPFESLPETMTFWKNMKLPEEELAKIFYKNAQALLASCESN